MSRNVKEMIGGCCVCSDEQGWSVNPLVYCDGQGCNVAVHQACYGIVQVPTGPWFCKKCESQERIVRVKCELCPQRDGALKRTNSGGWCHVVCALYIPEAWFANVQTMEPIVLSSVPPDRFHKTCYICEEQKRDTKATAGACMQCNRNGCKQYFHVTCAQAQGLLCEVTGSYENVKYCGYCSHHYKKLKNLSNVKTIPAFRPIPNDNETPDSSPEKNPPIIYEEEKKEPNPDPPAAPVELDVKSPQVDQSVSSTSDSLPPKLLPNNKVDSTLPSASSTFMGNGNEVSEITSAVSPAQEEIKSPASEQNQEPSSSVSTAIKSQASPLTPMLQDGSATSSTENLFDMNVASAARSIKKEPSSKKSGKKATSENSSNNGPKRQRIGSSDKVVKALNKKSKSSVTSTVPSTSGGNREGTKKHGGKRTRHQSGSSTKSHGSTSSHSQTTLPGHHDYCGSVFGGSPYFQSLSAPGHVNLPSFSSSPVFLSSMSNSSLSGTYGTDFHHQHDPCDVKSNSSNLIPPLKTFSNPFQDTGSKNNFPLTMEQLLEQQWEHGAQFLMEQSDHFDISSLLNCLHRLKSENQQLEDQVRDLTSRRNHLMTVNARLSLPLSLLDTSPLMTRTSAWGSLEDISSPDNVQTPKFVPTLKMPENSDLVVEDIVSPAENPENAQASLKVSSESPGTSSNFIFSDSICPPQPLMYSVVNPPPASLGGGSLASTLSLPTSVSSSSSSSSSAFKSSFLPFTSSLASSANRSMPLLEPSLNNLHLSNHLRPNSKIGAVLEET